MNAAVVEAYDRPPRYTTFADPVPSENDLLVEVTAAALHPIVRALATGTHYGSTGQLNFIPGVDGVGRLPDGSRVYFGRTNDLYGTFAERSVTQSWLTLPLPDTLDEVTVAAMMNPGMSSWAALTARAKFVAGESVLILGATGVSGHLAVQIARRLGATRVIAAAAIPKPSNRPPHSAPTPPSLEQDPPRWSPPSASTCPSQRSKWSSTTSGARPPSRSSPPSRRRASRTRTPHPLRADRQAARPNSPCPQPPCELGFELSAADSAVPRFRKS